MCFLQMVIMSLNLQIGTIWMKNVNCTNMVKKQRIQRKKVNFSNKYKQTKLASAFFSHPRKEQNGKWEININANKQWEVDRVTRRESINMLRTQLKCATMRVLAVTASEDIQLNDVFDCKATQTLHYTNRKTKLQLITQVLSSSHYS